MQRELTITPILINHQAKPGENAWVKALVYEPSEENLLSVRGKMYAIFSLSSAVPVDFTQLMQTIIETIQESYFGNTDGSLMPTLEATLDSIHKKLILVAQQDKRLASGFNFNLLTAVSWGTVMYVGQLGTAKALLWRDQNLHHINDQLDKAGNLYVASGAIRPNDVFLLTTNEMVQALSADELKKALAQPANIINQFIEQHLPEQRTGRESGIALYIDIRQVPTPEQEGLKIVDSDQLPLTKNISKSTKAAGKKIGNASSGLKSWLGKLTHQRLGRLPLLPLAIILVLIATLVGSIIFNNATPVATKDWSGVAKQLEDQLTQAKDVASINPDRAQDVLNDFQDTLKQIPENERSGSVKGLSDQAGQVQDKLLGIIALSKTTKLAKDLPSVTPDQFVYYDGSVYLVDATKNALIKITNGAAKTIDTDTQLYAQNSKINASAAGIVVATPRQIAKVSPDGSVTKITNIAKSYSAMTTYGQNVYLLGDIDGQVYRLVDQGAKWGEPYGYFPSPLDPTGLQSLAIDGAVYILRQDDTVEKYTSGARQTLILERQGLVRGSSIIMTTEGDKNIYLLQEKGLSVWNKDGAYLGQYQLPKSPNWDAAAVDEANKTIYILSEGTLYQARLP